VIWLDENVENVNKVSVGKNALKFWSSISGRILMKNTWFSEKQIFWFCLFKPGKKSEQRFQGGSSQATWILA
jgi:hypothetical protein